MSFAAPRESARNLDESLPELHLIAAHAHEVARGFVPDQAPDDALPALTPRERQVLEAVSRGQTNAEIGARFAISPKTVDTHRMSLMRKLGVRSGPALIACAIRA